MSQPSSERFPRGALVGAAALIGVALLAAGAARLTGVGTTGNPTSEALERLALRFEDRPDGSVAIYDADQGRMVELLEPGTNGFIRSVVRGLARERRLKGIGPEPAFELVRWADGRLSIDDPTTGRTIELGAFGPTNASAFAQLMVGAGKAR